MVVFSDWKFYNPDAPEVIKVLNPFLQLKNAISKLKISFLIANHVARFPPNLQ